MRGERAEERVNSEKKALGIARNARKMKIFERFLRFFLHNLKNCSNFARFLERAVE